MFRKKIQKQTHPLQEMQEILTRLMYELVGSGCEFKVMFEGETALSLDSDDPRAILAWSELQLAYRALVHGEAAPDIAERALR